MTEAFLERTDRKASKDLEGLPVNSEYPEWTDSQERKETRAVLE